MIDLTKNYRVEQRVNIADSSNLGKEGLAKHVGTLHGFSVAYNDMTKRYKTGLDVYSPDVKNLPTAEYEKKVAWIKETKTRLEEQIGTPNILDANNSDFWDVWKVYIEVGQDKKLKVMGSHPQFIPSLYWEHALALITLEANDDLPLGRKDAGNPKYKGVPFVLTTSDEELTLSKDKVKKTRQRAVEMSKLFEGENADFNRAFSIAYLLGVQKEDVGVEKLEEVLEIFSVQPEYLDKFLTLCKVDNEELNLKVTLKKAIDYDIIKYRTEDRLFYRGGKNFRQTVEDTVEYFRVSLAEPDMAREFMDIKAEVSKKDSKKKKK